MAEAPATRESAPSALPAIIRTPDQRLRVFISSTLQEMAPERAAVREAVTRLRLTPVMFELGARPHPPRNLYRAYLQQSDIFIGLYWQRYGWVAPDMDVSGLEDEYNLSGGKPSLIYIKTPAPDREPRLKELLARVQSDDRVSYRSFSTPEELRDLVVDDLAIMLTESFEVAQMRTQEAQGAGYQMSGVGHEPPGVEPQTPSTQHLAPDTRFNNLPLQRTSLVGRESEVNAARELIMRADVGLVTFTGTGGTGKTRLALHVAAEIAGSFKDGVCFVPLAAINQPDLVATAISQQLRVPETSGRPSLESLREYLADKQILLLLDNFEQVVDAAPLVVSLLDSCPDLKVIATSRSSLHVRPEKEFPVPPLDLPELGEVSGVGYRVLDVSTGVSTGSPGDQHPRPSTRHPEELAHCSAVALFVERARDVKPDFKLTEENAGAVAEICRSLDGLPLAIELAAARVKFLTPQAMLKRLGQRLPLLTGGARNMPERQQTMKSAIEWSYGLLNEPEQRLFARLSVFAGGCTIEAAEIVCNADGELGPDLLDLLGSLVDKSLLRQEEREESEPRLRVLQVIREYACERLQESGEEGEIRRAHANFYLKLAEAAEAGMRSGSQEAWLEHMELEHDNMRSALTWAIEHQQAEVAQDLSASLWQFWESHGYWNEAREWLTQALSVDGTADTSARAKALGRAGWMAVLQADYKVGIPLLQESLDVYRRLGDKAGVARSTSILGAMLAEVDQAEEGLKLLQESLALRRELGDRNGLTATLLNIGYVHLSRKEWDEAKRYTEESLALAREVNDESHINKAVNNLGNIFLQAGDYLRATACYNECLEICRKTRDKPGLAFALTNLARVALARGRYEEAEKLTEQGLVLWRELGSTAALLVALGLLGMIALATNRGERAVRFFGTVEAHRDAAAVTIEDMESDLPGYGQAVDEVRSKLSNLAWSLAWEEGQGMSLAKAADYALIRS